jgi:hypothetical protein
MASRSIKLKSKTRAKSQAKKAQRNKPIYSWFIRQGTVREDGTDSQGFVMTFSYGSEAEARKVWKTSFPDRHPFFHVLGRTSYMRNGPVHREDIERRDYHEPRRSTAVDQRLTNDTPQPTKKRRRRTPR